MNQNKMNFNMSELMPNIDSNFWVINRVKSYNHWPYKSESQCNPERMANAGFVCVGGKDEPDLVECFMCAKQLDGWDINDDPWEEHCSHQPSCPFVLLNKRKEGTWTIVELFSMVKQFYMKECTRQKEKIINDLKAQQKRLSAEIPIVYKNSHKNRNNLK